MPKKDKEKIVEEEVVIPKIYTDIVTVSKIYSILREISLDWIMTGKMTEELDIGMLAKQAKGEGSFNKDKISEKLSNFYEYLFKAVDKLILNGKEAKLVEMYEVVTRTSIEKLDELDIEILLGAIANFSLSIAKKVPKYIAPILYLKNMMKM